MPTKKERPGARLKAGVDTVLIGFKGPADLKRSLERSAKYLGLDPSKVLRSLVEDFVAKVEKMKSC